MIREHWSPILAKVPLSHKENSIQVQRQIQGLRAKREYALWVFRPLLDSGAVEQATANVRFCPLGTKTKKAG
ncbi:MAG: hypothetical protein JNK34_00825 [Tabrizicola sp.]|nr:hypothetical protein [Tabrizicola sp.]